MKTKVEINGYEIAIEDIDGNITVTAQKGGETVEEFTLSAEGAEDTDSTPTDSYDSSDDIKGFGEFGNEESDFQTPEDEMESEVEDEAPDAFGEEGDEYSEEEEASEPEGSEEENDDYDSEEESPEAEDASEDESSEGEEEAEEEAEEEEAPVAESLKTFQTFINSKRKK